MTHRIEASVDCHECGANAGELHADDCDTYALCDGAVRVSSSGGAGPQ